MTTRLTDRERARARYWLARVRDELDARRPREDTDNRQPPREETGQ